MTVLNLRGIRESGSIFAVPTYLFLIGMFVHDRVGIVRNAIDGFPVHRSGRRRRTFAGPGRLALFIILKAFSSGCAAMTGVEAISDGVPAFEPPEWNNARTTLTLMITILAVTFAGITFLAHQYGAFPMEAASTATRRSCRRSRGRSSGAPTSAYYYIQFATMAILVLAANTAYSDFPRLAYFLARDRFMPRQFTFRGDRLAFTTGIVTLGVAGQHRARPSTAAKSSTDSALRAGRVHLVHDQPVRACSCAGDARREPGWQSGQVINLVGASVTGLVAIIVADHQDSRQAPG